MFAELYQDIQRQFRSGNMVTRLIIINGAIFVVTSLLSLFTGFNGGNLYHRIIDFLSLSSDPSEALRHFWGFITYNFLHRGFWHLLWNMLFLYWFGRIVGDLIGNKHIFPLYILGGIAGGLLYLIGNILIPYGGSGASYIVGSSAAVMAVVVASAAIAPDYELNLLFIGRVRLKYIVLILVFLDLISTAGVINSGGHFAHLGGATFGFLYIYWLRKGIDLSAWWVRLTQRNRKTSGYAPGRRTFRTSMRVTHRKRGESQQKRDDSLQAKVDEILDKINRSGYDSLTDIEKETLYQAAKKNK